MRIIVPKKVKVGGILYSVEKVPDDEDFLDGGAGRCNRQKNRIVIQASMSKQQQQQVFLHELLHACDPNERIPEQQVASVAHMLFAVIVDNDLFAKD